jgi:hypothetical protein
MRAVSRPGAARQDPASWATDYVPCKGHEICMWRCRPKLRGSVQVMNDGSLEEAGDGRYAKGKIFGEIIKGLYL